MGRFSSMQTFADTNVKSQPVSYEQAAAAPSSSARVIVPKINNTAGSSAGAGSSEFHNYRKLRRWENDRMEAMDEEEKRLAIESAFRAKVAANEAEAADRTRKRAEKRKRHKLRRKLAEQEEEDEDEEEEEEEEEEEGKVKGKNDGEKDEKDVGERFKQNLEVKIDEHEQQHVNENDRDNDDDNDDDEKVKKKIKGTSIAPVAPVIHRAPGLIDDDEDIIRVDGSYSTRISLLKS